MSLIPMMKLRLAAPEHLVDLGRIKDLNYIREQERRAAHRRDDHALRRRKLAAGARQVSAAGGDGRGIGDVQVRNMGTIGGSVAHADPAADYPAALQALEAKSRASAARNRSAPSRARRFLRRYVHHGARTGRDRFAK